MCTGGGRGGQIRTDDFLLPKQALYQAELRPVCGWAGTMGHGRAKARFSSRQEMVKQKHADSCNKAGFPTAKLQALNFLR